MNQTGEGNESDKLEDFSLPPIIIVDDNSTELALGARFYSFSKLKNPLLTFSSGEELMEYLDSVDQLIAPMPALVFLDIRMKGMTGLEALKSVRGRSGFEYKPAIYLLTHDLDPVSEEFALRNGADGFVNKPLGKQRYVEFLDGMVDVIKKCSQMVS